MGVRCEAPCARLMQEKVRFLIAGGKFSLARSSVAAKTPGISSRPFNQKAAGDSMNFECRHDLH
jgi:hypothetical protein